MKIHSGVLFAFLLAALPVGAQQKEAQGATPAAEKPAAEKPAAEKPSELDQQLAVLDEPLGALDSLALIRPEGTGTTEDLSGLDEEIEKYISGKKLRLIGSDEVFAKVGPEFEVSPAGIGGVAKKSGAAAALFPRVFMTDKAYDLQLWLVDAQGKVLLDKTVSLAALPPGTAAPAAGPVAAPETGAGTPVVPPSAGPPGQPPGPNPEAVDDYHQRALSLAPRRRLAGTGAAIGFSTGHVAMGMSSGPVIVNDWMVIEGAEPISEPRLAKLAGRNDIAKRIERDIGAIKTYRNVGIGMTLAGFVAAGVAAPFFKEGSDQGLTSAGVAVGVGSAVGAAGLVVWLIYAPQAARATTPYPAQHLITRDEAHEMIDSYNSRLRRELDLEDPEAAPGPDDSGPGSDREEGAPQPGAPSALEFMLLPDPRGGAVASFGFRF